ncbi:MAG TPA: T9SS type A sorting domain-containing protein [Bacteroidia bacterium]|jgi:hypothetical protein|nr:T9SS type A sorting domain-containing protein [Bacteroidia bacterium]
MKIILFAILTFSGISISAQQKEAYIIGGSNTNIANSMVQTSDGGYAITGYTNSFGRGNITVYVVKVDSNINLQWGKTIGGASTDEGDYIIQTRDKGYAVCGTTSSYGRGDFDAYLIKLDSLGNLTWTRTIGGGRTDGANSVVQTTDGGYALTGWTVSYGKDSLVGDNVYIIKLDSLGILQWTKTVGGTGGEDIGASIKQTRDGGYIVAGWTNSFGAGGYDCYVLRLDGSGNLLWTKTIGGSKYEQAYCIIQTNDKGFAFCGQTNSFADTNGDVYVVKLDSAGNMDWTRTIGGPHGAAGVSIIQTKDKGFVVCGNTGADDSVNGDVYVLKLDSIGNLLWTQTTGGRGIDYSNQVVQSKNGGFAVIGNTNSYASGYKMYLILLDSLGNSCSPNPTGGSIDSGAIIGQGGFVSEGGKQDTGGVVHTGGAVKAICPDDGINKINIPIPGTIVYPTPASKEVTFKINSGENKYLELSDITGREMETLPIFNNEIRVNISGFPAGIYFYEIMNNSANIVDRGKFSVAK